METHKNFKSFHRLAVTATAALLVATAANGAPVVGFGHIVSSAGPHNIGYVDVSVTPTIASGMGYVNVAVDIHGDGLDPGDWLVSNAPIPLHPYNQWHTTTFSYSFDLSTLAFSGSYTIYAAFDQSARAPGDFSGLTPTGGVPFVTYDIGNLQDGAPGLYAGVPAYGRGGSRSSSFVGAISPLAPQSRQEGMIYPDMPGILQERAECGPAAAAQSLLSLQRRHPDQLAGRLPEPNNLVQQLRRAMNWRLGIDFDADFAAGKQKVIRDNGLAGVIEVKKRVFNNWREVFDFIKEELKAGESVDLSIRYWDRPGHMLDKGHVVTVAGYFESDDRRVLFFRDPLTPGNTLDHYNISYGDIVNYKYAFYPVRATIENAVSQSVIPEPATMALLGIGALMSAMSGHRPGRSSRRSILPTFQGALPQGGPRCDADSTPS